MALNQYEPKPAKTSKNYSVTGASFVQIHSELIANLYYLKYSLSTLLGPAICIWNYKLKILFKIWKSQAVLSFQLIYEDTMIVHA